MRDERESVAEYYDLNPHCPETSLRTSASSPASCSGAMCCSVPKIVPIAVSPALCVGDAEKSAGTAPACFNFANPSPGASPRPWSA